MDPKKTVTEPINCLLYLDWVKYKISLVSPEHTETMQTMMTPRIVQDTAHGSSPLSQVGEKCRRISPIPLLYPLLPRYSQHICTQKSNFMSDHNIELGYILLSPLWSTAATHLTCLRLTPEPQEPPWPMLHCDQVTTTDHRSSALNCPALTEVVVTGTMCPLVARVCVCVAHMATALVPRSATAEWRFLLVRPLTLGHCTLLYYTGHVIMLWPAAVM